MSKSCLTILLLLTCFSSFSMAQNDVVDGKGATISVAKLPEFRVPIGQVYYERYCLFCHGVDGYGDGMNAYSLTQRPADLQQKVKVQQADDVKWLAVISDGGEKHGLSSAMPAFGSTISQQKIKKIITYIVSLPRSFKERPQSDDDGSYDLLD